MEYVIYVRTIRDAVAAGNGWKAVITAIVAQRFACILHVRRMTILPSILQKCEKIGVQYVQGSIGISLLNDTRDVDLGRTCTCISSRVLLGVGLQNSP